MSNIVAPPSPPSPFYIGKTLCGDEGCLDIFGYPLPNYLSQDIHNIVGKYDWYINNRTTLFNVSSLDINHEVVVAGYLPSEYSEEFNLNFKWYRKRNNELIFEYEVNTNGGGAAWIGYCTEESFFEEIAENGDYKVVITATGGKNFTQTINFAVKEIPPSLVLRNPADNGCTWIARFSNYFDTSNYIRAGIATERVINGQNNEPNGIKDYINALSSNKGCAAENTITNLQPAKDYTFYGFVQAANGQYYDCGKCSITTTGEPEKLPTPDSPRLSKRIEGGLELSLKTIFNATYLVRISKNGSSEYEYKVINTEETSILFTEIGLSYSTFYYFETKIYNEYGQESDWSYPSRFMTAPKTPTITIGSFLENSANINIDTEGNFTKIIVNLYYANDYSSVLQHREFDTMPQNFLFTNLKYNISYQVVTTSYFINIFDNETIYSLNEDSEYFTITKDKPPVFEWQSGVGGANNPTITLTANEWNRFLNTINTARRYKGISDFAFIYANTEHEITAEMFNQAIRSLWQVLPSYVSSFLVDSNGYGKMIPKENGCYWWYFEHLRAVLNSIR